MRQRLTEALRSHWRQEGGWIPMLMTVATLPGSVAFGAAVHARNWMYDRGVLPSSTGSLPVVSVGNLAVGGTGKTPVSAWLIRVLYGLGWQPALVSRGYGEDELRLHRRWNPEVPVIRAPNRVRGVSEALSKGRNIVVLDDGFQHRRLRRDIDIVLLSPAHPVPARLLPRGPYREPLSSLDRADLVLVTAKGPGESEAARALADRLAAVLGGPPVEVFQFRPGPWETLNGEPSPPPPSGRPFVVSSVAEPAAFRDLVEDVAGEVGGHMAFPDHHGFTRSDAGRIAVATGSDWIATTEKDAVKLVELREHLPEVRVLPLVPAPDEALSTALAARLEEVGHTLAQRERRELR